MEGIVVRVFGDKNFGFIKSDDDGKDYFFHKADLGGFFDDLVEDFEKGQKVKVTFDVVPSPKGARAGEVRRLDYPN